MGFMNEYQPDTIRMNVVPKEGRYSLRIEKVTEGQSEKDGKTTRYIRIECIVNSEGFPPLSLFLTEGESFNSNATAFFDTFNLNRSDFAFSHWIHARGNVDISLKKNDRGFINMIPHYIWGDDGFVNAQQAHFVKPEAAHIPAQQNAGDSRNTAQNESKEWRENLNKTLDQKEIPF